MKKINRLILLVVVGFLLVMCMVNGILLNGRGMDSDREYRVSINRIKEVIKAYEQEEKRAPDSLNTLLQFAKGQEVIQEYPGITGLYWIRVDAPFEELAQFLQEEPEDYVILTTREYYYRITYDSQNKGKAYMLFMVNGIAIGMLIVMLFLLFYVRHNIILPFYQLTSIPYELSKGNLTLPKKENKNR